MKQEFVFGEKLSDRVITTTELSPDFKLPTDNQSASTSSIVTPLIVSSNNNNNEDTNNSNNNNEDYSENDQESSLIKINCKLYILDAKKTWLERGYGMLKIIETTDKTNCKISE